MLHCYFIFLGIELVQDEVITNENDFSAGDGVKFSLPYASSNVEGPTVADTDQSVEELMNQMKTM